MRLIEIFYSLQGEGPFMGRPCTFVRLAGCNLNCLGCDTQTKQWNDYSLDDILKKTSSPRVTITGGEPTVQMQELCSLIGLLFDMKTEIHIETNGTNPIPNETLGKIHCVVVGPKRGSDYHLSYWAGMKNVHFKFVIGSLPWCWTVPLLEEILPELPKERVWLMAFGTDRELKGSENAWNSAMRLGVNYSDRLHIRIGKR